VLQQLEVPWAGDVSVNDCFRPVSRYFDRIWRPEQVVPAALQAMRVLVNQAETGAVTLAFPQDVQAEAYDFPEAFFARRVWHVGRPLPDEAAMADAAALIRASRRPLIVAGGGVIYSEATEALRRLSELTGVAVCETQAGKSSLPWDHPLQLGSVGVSGSPAANALASEADLILAVGTRLADFTTGSNSLFTKARLVSINVNPFDATKAHGFPLQSDARLGLEALSEALPHWRAEETWTERAKAEAAGWRSTVDAITQRRVLAPGELPYDGEVIGAVQRSTAQSAATDIVVCAAGTLPAELHKLWRTSTPGGYHMEYGYSCMGYEIAGGLGVKMARPDLEVIVMVGDGSYLMLNNEIATSVMLDKKLLIVVLDNRGYGCINRLQQSCGGAPFNNMLVDSLQFGEGAPKIDFAANAASLGALSEKVADIEELEAALLRARAAQRTYLICIDTDDTRTTNEGGWWWEVAVPEESPSDSVRQARAAYLRGKEKQKR